MTIHSADSSATAQCGCHQELLHTLSLAFYSQAANAAACLTAWIASYTQAYCLLCVFDRTPSACANYMSYGLYHLGYVPVVFTYTCIHSRSGTQKGTPLPAIPRLQNMLHRTPQLRTHTHHAQAHRRNRRCNKAPIKTPNMYALTAVFLGMKICTLC